MGSKDIKFFSAAALAQFLLVVEEAGATYTVSNMYAADDEPHWIVTLTGGF
ncbi:MAG: hypothetical protein GY753_11890 [Gammaproteobacteria bacterium]|nr:hypothetical protein [Gammaproteobacteria bacterium]